MKVRTSFVSNSSSCSYVVLCKRDFLNDIAKDLAKACTNKTDPYHDKDLAKKNQCILEFCLNTFQLAYLGNLVIETRKEIYNLEYFKNIFAESNQDNVEECAKEEWERYKSDLNALKNGKHDHTWWIGSAYDLDEYDAQTDTAIHYEKIMARDIIVSNQIMESKFKRYSFQNTPEDIKARVDKLVAYAKDAAKYDWHEDRKCIESPSIYQITKNTIDNTRALLSCGYSIDFFEWEKNLDELEARLSSGDAIFYVRIANNGDGYGDFYIYCEDTADSIDGISGIEILTSECG